MNKLGCSHGDYHIQNVGRNIEESLSAFDFDQAIMANPLQCLLRDFYGVGIYARPNDISLLQRARKVKIIWPIVEVLVLFKKVLALFFRGFRRRKDIIESAQVSLKDRALLLEDANINTLADAWTIAMYSNASSPGTPLAYYSLDICGINFPGERPWLLRWSNI